MEYLIETMTQESAEEIADNWKYQGEYAFYDMTADPEDYEELVRPDLRKDHYFQVVADGELLGFCCIFQEDAIIEFGLGMHPEIVGKGQGVAFSQAILTFIQQNYSYTTLRLAVATFNQRAINVYRKIGFSEVKTYQQATNGATYEFLLMEKKV